MLTGPYSFHSLYAMLALLYEVAILLRKVDVESAVEKNGLVEKYLGEVQHFCRIGYSSERYSKSSPD